MTQALINKLTQNGLNGVKELGINVIEHPSWPELYLFKYDQIKSPRFDPVVKEARGAVIARTFSFKEDKDVWHPVATPFNRFYNLGENSEQEQNFDWNDFTADVKEDGSLIIAYYWRGKWNWNTSGSWGFGRIDPYPSWHAYIEAALDKQTSVLHYLNKDYTYMFELVGRANQIVRFYDISKLILLGARVTETGEEKSIGYLEQLSKQMGIPRPVDEYSTQIKSRKDLENSLRRLEKENPTHEGFIVRDKYNNRIKCKTDTYRALHHLNDNGGLSRPAKIIELIIKGNTSKVIQTWPSLSEDIIEWEKKLAAACASTVNRYYEVKNVLLQKDFAALIKDHPFAHILFAARKTHKDVKQLFLEQEPEKLVEKLQNV